MRALPKTALLACFALSTQVGVAHAGFFDSLFGTSAPAYQPAPSYNPGSRLDDRYLESRPFERMRRQIHRAAAAPKEDHAAIKEAAKSTDLIHDRTLRSGDAVMTDKGVRIYSGDKRSGTHDRDEFAKLSDVQGMSRELRTTLDAINAHRSQSTWQVGEAEVPLQTGRSVYGDLKPPRTTTDKEGRTIRVVGP